MYTKYTRNSLTIQQKTQTPLFWFLLINYLKLFKFMRLVYEQHTFILDVLNSYEWLPIFKNINMMLWNDPFLIELSLDTLNLNPLDLFNIYTTNFFDCIDYYNAALISEYTYIFLKYIDLFASYQSLFFVQAHTSTLYFIQTATLTTPFSTDFNIAGLLFCIYFLLLIWYIGLNMSSYSASIWFNITQVLHLWLTSWILSSIDKVESTEEVLCLAILWPWCFLIIFSHLYSVSNYSYTFGFAEWGLPIAYGLIMLIEHWWAFGSYLLLYLTNIKGRRSLLATLVEDLIALAILIARVMLQAVRGIIVGMFHFICREAIWNMTPYWSHNNHVNTHVAQITAELPTTNPGLDLLSNIALTSGSFIVITAIMVLQLIFLVISVWLFCKCWFISFALKKLTIQPVINA